MKSFVWHRRWPGMGKLGAFSLLSGLFLWGSLPAQAADRLILQLGPFHATIAVADLEHYAKTGEYPPALKPYAPLLTAELREVLNRRIQLDPQIGDKVVDDFLRSPSGEALIQNIGVAIPNSTVEQLQAALTLAVRQANGLSLVSFLKAYPTETVTLDASAALGLALQLSPSVLQSQALGPLLQQELAVKSSQPFRAAFDPSQAGRYGVMQETLSLADRQRQRVIEVDIYWGVGEQMPYNQTQNPTQNPLVVLSHGFGADRTFLGYLARHLASHGLTVAALEHPESNATWLMNHSGGVNPGDLLPPRELIERPKDISFVLDEFTQINRQPGPLQGKLNTQQVSAIGHSLGGYTVLAAAGAELDLDYLREQCKDRNPLRTLGADWLACTAADLPEKRLSLRDRRIAQVIAINPAIGNLFGKNGIAQVTVPTLMFSGTEDSLTPMLTHQIRPFTQLRGPKYFVTAIGGTHLSISNFAVGSQGELLTRRTLVNERIGRSAEPLRQLLQGLSLSLIKQLTPSAETYRPFLSAEYTQSLSTPEMPLRFTTAFPSTVRSWLELSKTPKPDRRP